MEIDLCLKFLFSFICVIHSSFLMVQVHLDYLEAGADVIITASYQVGSVK